MELKQVLGNTYVMEAQAGTLVFYKTGAHEGILIDTGYAQEDREELIRTFELANIRPKGVIVSHTHYDHAGNAQALKDRYGCPILASLAEAGTAMSVMSYRTAYPAMTPKEIDDMMVGQCYCVDQVILPSERVSFFCGVPFGILPLYGHTPGHIGVVTPDHVAYLADALMSEAVMRASKMPSAVCREDDLKAKKSLHALKCEAYVLAHRGVHTHAQIDELIDKMWPISSNARSWSIPVWKGTCPRRNGCAPFTAGWRCTAGRRSNAPCASAICAASLIIWLTAAAWPSSAGRAFAGIIKNKRAAGKRRLKTLLSGHTELCMLRREGEKNEQRTEQGGAVPGGRSGAAVRCVDGRRRRAGRRAGSCARGRRALCCADF